MEGDLRAGRNVRRAYLRRPDPGLYFGSPAALGSAVLASAFVGLTLVALACTRKSDPTAGAPNLVRADLATVESRLGPGGGVRVVNLWATWCLPCIEELPDLAALDAAQRERGVKVIGISLDLALPNDEVALESRVLDLLREREVRYENLLYTGSVSSLLDALDLPGPIPYTLLVGNDGQILWRHEGRTTLARIEEALREATGGPPDA